MFSTPLKDYFDDPDLNAQFLEDLNKNDTHYYALGYIQACSHVRETLTDMKSKYLTVVMSTEDSDIISKGLSIANSLDTVDKALKDRTEVLLKEIISQPLTPD